MSSIEYQETDINGIELIRPLWDQLNRHHYANARAFRDVYAGWTFDERKAYFVKIAHQRSLRIDLAFNRETSRYVGYCVSSLSEDRDGEVESIFVEGSCRSRGIGTGLMTRALTWLRQCGAGRIRVSVADGNETTFPFYRKFGFYPRLTVLEQRAE